MVRTTSVPSTSTDAVYGSDTLNSQSPLPSIPPRVPSGIPPLAQPGHLSPSHASASASATSSSPCAVADTLTPPYRPDLGGVSRELWSGEGESEVDLGSGLDDEHVERFERVQASGAANSAGLSLQLQQPSENSEGVDQFVDLEVESTDSFSGFRAPEVSSHDTNTAFGGVRPPSLHIQDQGVDPTSTSDQRSDVDVIAADGADLADLEMDILSPDTFEQYEDSDTECGMVASVAICLLARLCIDQGEVDFLLHACRDLCIYLPFFCLLAHTL